MDEMLGSLFSSTNPRVLLKMTPLAPAIQRHLSKVYSTLSLCLLMVAAGCAVSMQLPFLFPAWLGLVGIVGLSIALYMTPATPEMLSKRYKYLAGISLCKGATLAPLVSVAAVASPSLIVTAALSTAAVFGCFTVSSLLSPRRSFFFLSSYLSSAALLMLGFCASSFFLGAGALGMQVELYVGLLIFAGYILVDTQVIVEKAAAGEQDHIKHALCLLSDLVALFARILIILLNNRQKAEQEEGRRRRQKRS